MAITFRHEIYFMNGTSEDRELIHNIFTLTKSTHNKTSSIMATIEERFNDVITKMDTATTNLANQIRDLKGQLTNQGLPADKEEAILTRMEGIANNLDQIGKDPENPVPTGEEGPISPNPGGDAGGGPTQ